MRDGVRNTGNGLEVPLSFLGFHLGNEMGWVSFLVLVTSVSAKLIVIINYYFVVSDIETCKHSGD